MVQIHVAYTEAINPAGSGDVLSRDQVGHPSLSYWGGETCCLLFIVIVVENEVH